MTWQPLERLPTALDLALCDAVRATVLQRDVGRGIRRDADGMLIVPLGEAMLHVGFHLTGERAMKHGQRQAMRYDFDGRAVVGRQSYGLSARAILDTRSQAFLDVACDIVWQDGARV